MKLFNITFEVRYPQEKPEVFKFREKIFSKIAEDEKFPDFQDGLQFLLKDRHIKIVVDSKRFGMDIAFNNSVSNPIQYGKDNIIKIIKLINSELGIKSVDRIGVRTFWLHEVDLSIDELIHKYKEHFYRENELVASSKDVALVLEMVDGNIKINYNSGPMGEEQILEVLNANLERVGHVKVEKIKTSVFLDYDYYSGKKFAFAEEFYKDFLEKGINSGKKSMEKTCEILEVL